VLKTNHATDFSPQLMTEKLSADLEWNAGRGTRDGMKWEGEAPAEPKRQRMVSSE
jgi:hypothetical protein